MQLNQLLHIDTKLQEFTVDVWTREVWYDWRLRHNDSQAYDCFRNQTAETWTVIPAVEVDMLWNPHFGSKALVETPELLDFEAWISSNGRVWLCKRQVLKFSCLMDFAFMPYDTQVCHVPVQLVSYYPHEVVLVPGVEDGIAMKITPRQSLFVGGPVDWNIVTGRSFGSMVCEDIGAVSGCTTFLKLTFTLQRQPEFYMRHHMIPVFLCMILSYSSFFIIRAAAPARVAITAIAFLTLSSRIGVVLASLPNLPGSVWLLDLMEVSLYFALFANIEYALVNYLLRTDARVKKRVTAAIKAIDERLQNIEVGDHPPVACPENVSETGPREEAVSGEDTIAAARPHRRFSEDHLTLAMPPRGSASHKSFMGELEVELRKTSCRLDRLIVSRHGTIFFTGQHIDIFSRYAFVVAYAVVLGYFYAVLPADD